MITVSSTVYSSYLKWSCCRNDRRCPGVMTMSPLVGSNCPDKIFKKVDLPAPFSPRSTWTLPGSTLTETLFTTLVLPNILETPTRDSCVIFSRFPYGCGNVTAPRCTYSLGLLKQAQAACIDVVDQNRRLAPAISCVSCPSSDRLDRSSLNIDCLHSPGSRVTSLNHVKEGFRA